MYSNSEIIEELFGISVNESSLRRCNIFRESQVMNVTEVMEIEKSS